MDTYLSFESFFGVTAVGSGERQAQVISSIVACCFIVTFDLELGQREQRKPLCCPLAY